jgi:hypothetical protein
MEHLHHHEEQKPSVHTHHTSVSPPKLNTEALAIVIVNGLISATLLAIFIFPVIVRGVYRKKYRARTRM